MMLGMNLKRWTAALLLAGLVVATIAPAAQAGYGSGYGHTKYRRYDGCNLRVIRPIYAPRRVVVVRRSCEFPAFAGFLGGLVLGAAISNAAPHETYYYDPYCHERFATLDGYRGHLRHFHHPWTIRVIAVSSGACVNTYRYHDGRWSDWDGDRGGYVDDRGGYYGDRDDNDQGEGWDD